MASLKIDNVPEELLKQLNMAAEARRRQLDEEAIERLADSFGPRRHGPYRSAAELSKLARQVRGEVPGVWLTPEFIRMAREYGRE